MDGTGGWVEGSKKYYFIWQNPSGLSNRRCQPLLFNNYFQLLEMSDVHQLAERKFTL